MRFLADHEPFLNALSFVAKYADTGRHIPILGHVRIEAKGGSVEIVTTNTIQSGRDRCPANVEAEGAVCLPCDFLLRAVKSRDAAEISVATENDRVEVRVGKSRFVMPSLPASDFLQPVNLIAPGVDMVLPAGVLGDVARRAGYATEKNTPREYLRGILWRSHGSHVEFCTASAGMLARLTIDAPIGADCMPDMIVPKFAMPDWLDPVKVTCSKNFVRLECGSQAVALQLIEGEYPDIGRLFPDGGTDILLDRAELLSTARRVALVSDDGRAVPLLLVGRDGEIAVAGTGRGEANDTVRYDGPDFQTCFLDTYLIPVLAAFDCEMVRLRWRDHSSAVIVNAGDAQTALLQPYRDARLSAYLPKVAA